MSCLSFGRAAFRLSIKDFEEKSKEESVIKGNICYYVSDKSGLCAQTRASSLTGGMPVW